MLALSQLATNAALSAAPVLFDDATLLETRTISAQMARAAAVRMKVPPGVRVHDGDAAPSSITPGHRVPLRVYEPMATAGGAGAVPCVVFVHGGGFVLGTLDSAHAMCLALADRAGSVVISVDYRLAPEHAFPLPLEDCYDAVRWTADPVQLRRLRIDPARIAVGGASAGGCLATAVAQLCRDRPGSPALCFQLLIYPVTDSELTAGARAATATPVLTGDSLVNMWRHYLGPGVNPAAPPPYAAPLHTPSLAGLPPAYIELCELDPLRDEGIAYAQRLLGEGVSVELVLRRACPHGFELYGPRTEVTLRAVEDRVRVLRQAFDPALLSRL